MSTFEPSLRLHAVGVVTKIVNDHVNSGRIRIALSLTGQKPFTSVASVLLDQKYSQSHGFKLGDIVEVAGNATIHLGKSLLSILDFDLVDLRQAEFEIVNPDYFKIISDWNL